MDWSNETYVRLYVSDTLTWRRLRWQGQCVLMQLMRKLDRSGAIDSIRDLTMDVAIITGMPDDVVAEGIEALLREEVFMHSGDTLIMPKYMEAQEANKSDKQRQKESRDRKRDCIMSDLSQNVTGESRAVTKASLAVTDKPVVSRGVTLNCALPSSALHSSTEHNTPKPPRGIQSAFDIFWLDYPKKTGKQAALKAWNRNKPDLQKCIVALADQKCSEQWSKDGGQYIPNPATWINQGRWDDEAMGKQHSENNSGFEIV